MKRYDRAYFDRWYRDPRRRTRTEAELRRHVALVVAMTEYVLERPLRTVLDVGCGEGAVRPLLKRLRPRARYTGIDPSQYAVQRYGARRDVRAGTLAGLADHAEPAHADLILCSDVLHYLSAPEVEEGLERLSERLIGVAYLPVFTSADPIQGDLRGWYRRPPSYYRRLFARSRLVSYGPHCYITAARAAGLAALERSPAS